MGIHYFCSGWMFAVTINILITKVPRPSVIIPATLSALYLFIALNVDK